MSKNNFNEIKNTVQKYGLKPASQRDLPLFTLSCIAQGYTNLLLGSFGISYKAVAAIGGKGKIHTMFNEEYVAKEMEVLVAKKMEKIKNIIFPMLKKYYFNVSKKVKIYENSASGNPEKCLDGIIKVYPEYMQFIGVYNCFWRYIGDKENKIAFSRFEIKKIAAERDKIAAVYPSIEEIIRKSCGIIGDKMRFDGDLLRYFTRLEMSAYLKKNNLSKKILRELKLSDRDIFIYLLKIRKKK